MNLHLPAPIPRLLPYADVAVLLMRLLVGAVFVTSGGSHVRDPVARGESIGLPPGVTRLLGIAELAGGLGVRSSRYSPVCCSTDSAREICSLSDECESESSSQTSSAWKRSSSRSRMSRKR